MAPYLMRIYPPSPHAPHEFRRCQCPPVAASDFIFTAGRRFPQQASDTIKAWRHVPLFEYVSADDLFDHLPKGCIPVAVELATKARSLPRFIHPERACYILGAEDTGVPKRVLDRCPLVVEIPSDRCLNVAVAGSIVLYDRLSKSIA